MRIAPIIAALAVTIVTPMASADEKKYFENVMVSSCQDSTDPLACASNHWNGAEGRVIDVYG